jgi:hypothetical protein
MRVVATVILAVLLPACGGKTKDAGEAVVGSPQDVHAALGDQDGFALVNDCSFPHTNFGVIGRGGGWFEGVEPGAMGRAQALERAANLTFAPALRDLPSVFGVGWGSACRGTGIFVLTNAWPDVDAIVARVGALLKAGDLREEVAVTVEGLPVAL